MRRSRTSVYLWFLTLAGFRRRTPGPPPFSSMNSTPGQTSAEGPSGYMPYLSRFLGRLGAFAAGCLRGNVGFDALVGATECAATDRDVKQHAT